MERSFRFGGTFYGVSGVLPRGGVVSIIAAVNQSLEQSYDLCRRIARRTAKNFYYSFLVMPRLKRDAMCAIYAFMRRSDDIADSAANPAGVFPSRIFHRCRAARARSNQARVVASRT